MSRSIRIAGALVLSSFLFSPLAMAEESPVFASRTMGQEQKIEQQQLAYENSKKDDLKTQQASAAPTDTVKGSHA